MDRFLSRSLDGEAEWTATPRRRRVETIYDDDDDDDQTLGGFIVPDSDGDEEDDASDDDNLSDAAEEAEEDDAFDRPLNRPRRATSDKPKRKRADGESTPRRNRTRRRELAAIRPDDDLDDPTRRAREAEKERAALALFEDDELDAENNAALPEELEEQSPPLVCLNPKKENNQPPEGKLGALDQPIFVHPAISGKLKKHQIKGAQFLWSHVAPEPTGFGCVLADFMGLGKTLQVITVVQAFLAMKRRSEDGELRNRHKHVLILAPTICVRNWEAEVVKWLGKKDARKLGVFTLESSREKKMSDRVHVVKNWHKRGGLLIMGYELYRILVLQSSGEEKIAAGNSKVAHLIREVYQCLSDPGPDLMVLDEGHRVRDHKSKLVKALKHVKTPRRIILTGYPLQNHLEEYWTMVNFARPDYLGSLEDFKNRFVHPIENGQCIDSTESDRKLARQRAFILTTELKTLVLRRDQEFLFKQLPPKKEWVLLCKLAEPQATLYRRFLECGVPTRPDSGKVDVLGGYHISLAISNHPDVLQETYLQLEEALRKGTLGKGLKKSRARAADEEEDEDLLRYLAVDFGRANTAAASRRQSEGLSDEDSDTLLDALNAPAGSSRASSRDSSPMQHRLSFAKNFMRQYVSDMLKSSGKMQLLMEILRECKSINDRVILFSQSIPTLNTIEKMIHQSNRREKRHADRISYLRIDGSTPQQERFRMIGQFNDWEEDADLIMISTKAGGEGVNLCAGNRIIIFDVCWNPCNDSQSMCRSYRFGQVKPVFVYRFVSAGTMEKKVYDLQIRKEGVAKRIVDEKALERKFKTADLQNYFNMEDFEQAMQQQSAVLAPLTKEKAASSDAEGSTSSDEDVSIITGPIIPQSSAPGGDHILQKVLNKMYDERHDWVLEWFEQESMFEETLDDACSIAEQEEITSSYTYIKALRNLKLDDYAFGINREKVLVVPCAQCRVPNNVYPEELTKVPVPKYVECRYCRRPTPTAGALSQAEIQANAAANGGMPGLGGRGYLPYNTSVMTGNVPTQIDTGAAANGLGVPAATLSGLAPHIQALAAQQQQQQQQRLALLEQQRQLTINEQLRRQREQQIRERTKKLLERKTWKLADRNLLVLRRGIQRVQDLKSLAQECGASIAIELNPQLTDIVSGLSEAETLGWLKIKKLPRDVELHDEAWLRNEIAKEKGLAPVTTTPANASSPSVATETGNTSPETVSSVGADTSHDTIAIELLDSDDDDDGDVIMTPAPAQTASSQTNQDDDDDDIVEIL